MLRQCHDSVLAQNVSVDHFMIADGHPNAEVATWAVQHIVLNSGHDDNGNTPRGIGGLLAQKQGYDFVTYLDADNWYHPGHLQSMLDCYAKTQADVCCSLRTYHHQNGAQLDVMEQDENMGLHVDTSCMFIHKRAYRLLGAWQAMPKPLSPIGDRVMLGLMKHERYSLAFTQQRSVAFRSQYESHYRHAAHLPAIPLKGGADLKPCFDWLMQEQGVIDCMESLRFWPMPFLRQMFALAPRA